MFCAFVPPYSMSGYRVINKPSIHVYAATKYAVKAITDGLRNEVNGLGSHIRVTVCMTFYTPPRATYPSVMFSVCPCVHPSPVNAAPPTILNGFG